MSTFCLSVDSFQAFNQVKTIMLSSDVPSIAERVNNSLSTDVRMQYVRQFVHLIEVHPILRVH
jgi:hypothetical protein